MAKTFEGVIGEIDSILQTKKSHWNLEVVTQLDYDDVCQIIRLHLYKKFALWDQSKPFGPWCHEVVRRQIANLKQQHYGKFAPPCRTCKWDLGGGRCGLTSDGIKTSECAKFGKWEKSKESAYRMLLAESSDRSYNDEGEVIEKRIRVEADTSVDYLRASTTLNELVMHGLSEKMRNVYRWLYIENRSDKWVAEKMGFRTNELGKNPGYRQISNMKNTLIARAKKVMLQKDIFTQ